MKSNDRLKILVAAYACEPDKGSEPGVGWNWVKQLSLNNNVWVLTRKNNRPGIERELSARPNSSLHFEYVDLPRYLRFWKKGLRGIRTYYHLWQIAALIRAWKLHSNVGFDCGHHVSFVTDWQWTLFALMPIPYVWGPIGSNPKAPPDLLPDNRARLMDNVRYTFQCFMRWADPLYWLSAVRASAVIVIGKENARLCPLKWLAGRRLMIEPAVGIDQLLPVSLSKAQKNHFEVLYVGYFHHTKAAHLAIEAFAQLASRIKNARLTVVGQGPEEFNIRRRIERRAVGDKVKLISSLPREEVLKLMRNSDIFLFPSMEGGGMVVLEAMASGKPVVCLQFGGPGEMVTSTSGIRVAVGNMEEVTERLADAMEDLAKNPEKRRAMGLCAADEVRCRFAWTTKIDRIQKLYGSTAAKNYDPSSDPRIKPDHDWKIDRTRNLQ